MKRCLPIILLLLSASAHGALNKWVDTEDNVHYSDEPPPTDVKAQKLTIPSAASGVPAQKTFVEREAERRKAIKAREEAAKTVTEEQESTLIKRKNCEGAKTNLRTFESNTPIATYNDKGESINMDAAARQQSAEEARKQISMYCN